MLVVVVTSLRREEGPVGTIEVVERPRRLMLIIVGILVAGSSVAGPVPLTDLEPVSAVGVQCDPGTYSDTGFQPCVLAESGHFVDVMGATQQTACPVGYYQPLIGQIFCRDADEGHYVDEPASTSQSPCSPGTFNSMRGQASCTVAEPGSYVDTEGAAAQVPCPIGTFSAVSGASSCTPAPVGSFVAETGATSATACPVGSTTLDTGQSECIPDPTAPVVTMSVTGGTLGSEGWYTSGPVVVAFEVDDPESDETVDGCDGGSVSASTSGTTFACSATSVGGTATESITIRLDADKPVITFTGNAGSYRVVSTVAIRCAAADAVSGVADVRCPRVDSPAWRLKAGRTTLAARATDRAGNLATASSSFTVRVTSKDLCALTRRFVTSSKRYVAAKPSAQRSADAAVRNVCMSTGRAKAFREAVDGLATDKYLASAQAKALKRLVAAL